MTIQTDNTRLQPLCMRSGTANSRVGGGLFTPPPQSRLRTDILTATRPHGVPGRRLCATTQSASSCRAVPWRPAHSPPPTAVHAAGTSPATPAAASPQPAPPNHTARRSIGRNDRCPAGVFSCPRAARLFGPIQNPRLCSNPAPRNRPHAGPNLKTATSKHPGTPPTRV